MFIDIIIGDIDRYLEIERDEYVKIIYNGKIVENKYFSKNKFIR